MTELEKLRAELADLIDEERRVCGVIVKLQEHSAALTEKICKLRVNIKAETQKERD